VAQDGSLLVSDDGSNSIWRISYTGTNSETKLERDHANHHIEERWQKTAISRWPLIVLRWERVQSRS